MIFSTTLAVCQADAAAWKAVVGPGAAPEEMAGTALEADPGATARNRRQCTGCSRLQSVRGREKIRHTGAADVTTETMRKRRTTDAYRSHSQSWTWLRST